MTPDNLLSQRLADVRLEIKLWILVSIATPIACATGAGAWLHAHRAAPTLWRDYQLARLLDAVGLGTFDVPGWRIPAVVLDVVPQHVPPSMLAQWDGDLSRLAAAAGVGLGAVVLALVARLFGFSFSQREA